MDASGSQWTPTYTLLNRCGIRAYLIFRPFSHCRYVELYMYSCCPILTRFYRCGSSRTCPINIGVFLFLFVFFPASFSFVVLSFSPSVRPSRWQARLCYRKNTFHKYLASPHLLVGSLGVKRTVFRPRRTSTFAYSHSFPFLLPSLSLHHCSLIST